MTVQDLIRYLERLPKDAVIGVVYRMYSDLSILDEADMTFADKAYLDENGGAIGYRRRRYVLRNGNIMEYDEKTWPKEETPHFVPVLILPGN